LRRLSDSSLLPLLRESRLGCLMLAGEPAALPALEVVSDYTDALVQCWGQTEAPASTTMLSRQEMGDRSLWPSIGRPIPGVEFALVVDGQITDELRPGVEGELVLRSGTVASALLGAEAEHQQRQLGDGWWATSDLGRFDDDGRVYIVGRASEVIITGGTNIQPMEIERALEEHHQVIEAVVVGVPDHRWGETPAALVYAPDLVGRQPDELDSWMRSRLAGFKRPGHLFVSAHPIPRLSSESKIARGELKRSIAAWVSQPDQVPAHVTKVVH
jgi:fatty-acyl-CoA synthase